MTVYHLHQFWWQVVLNIDHAGMWVLECFCYVGDGSNLIPWSGQVQRVNFKTALFIWQKPSLLLTSI